MSWKDRRMNRDWSRIGSTLKSPGSVGAIRCRRASTPSTTSTVFVPDCLRIISEMAGRPSSRMAPLGSSTVSRTRPMSLNRMTAPSLYEMMMLPKSLTSVRRPIVRSAISDGPVR